MFGAHGFLKWAGGIDRFAGYLMTLRFPAPDVLARAVGALELGGAVLLVLGVLTRPAGALLAAEMAVVITVVQWRRGFIPGFEFETTLCAAALALAVAGGGRLSLGRGALSR